jgi:hypothetical protein
MLSVVSERGYLRQRLQPLAGFEAHHLAGRYGHCSAGARVAANTGFARAHVEDAESAELDALATAQSTLHSFKDDIDSDLGLPLADAGAVTTSLIMSSLIKSASCAANFAKILDFRGSIAAPQHWTWPCGSFVPR